MATSLPLLIAATLAALFLVSRVFRLLRGDQFEVNGKTILITGGSDGLGKSLAIQLAQQGANVAIVARNKEKLAQALDEIKSAAASPNQTFTAISADLTSPPDADRALADATAFNNNTPPDIVWCCAGNCVPGFFASSPLDTLRAQMDTVYWTAAYTAHSALRRWLEPAPAGVTQSGSPRHIVFTSSTLAFTPVAGYAPYTPAKAAMRALADTLAQEVAVYNGARRCPSSAGSEGRPARDIKVHIVFPMGILTPGYAQEQRTKPALTKKLEETDKPQTPEEVARVSVEALRRGEFAVTTNWVGRMMLGSAWGASVRGDGVVDTIVGVVSAVVFWGVGWELRRTAGGWGRRVGLPEATK